MVVEKRVLRHRCGRKRGCVGRTEGSGSSTRAQPRDGAPSPACESVRGRRRWSVPRVLIWTRLTFATSSGFRHRRLLLRSSSG